MAFGGVLYVGRELPDTHGILVTGSYTVTASNNKLMFKKLIPLSSNKTNLQLIISRYFTLYTHTHALTHIHTLSLSLTLVLSHSSTFSFLQTFLFSLCSSLSIVSARAANVGETLSLKHEADKRGLQRPACLFSKVAKYQKNSVSFKTYATYVILFVQRLKVFVQCKLLNRCETQRV